MPSTAKYHWYSFTVESGKHLQIPNIKCKVSRMFTPHADCIILFHWLNFRTFHTTMKLSDHIIKIDDAFITLPPPFEGSNHDLGPLSTAGTFILTLHGSKTKIYPCWRRPVCGPKIGSSTVQNRPFHYCNGQIRIQIWIKHILKYKSTRSCHFHCMEFNIWIG